MGFLGGEITVDNRTAYYWTCCIEIQTPWLFSDQYKTFAADPYKKTQQSQTLLIKWGQTIYLRVKYGWCSETECCKDPDLWYIFDPRDDPCFTIRESGDHLEIHMDCNVNYEKKKSTCPNYDPSHIEAPSHVEAPSGVEAPFSVLMLISSVVTASPYLLVTIILLIKCYRARVKTDGERIENAVIEE